MGGKKMPKNPLFCLNYFFLSDFARYEENLSDDNDLTYKPLENKSSGKQTMILLVILSSSIFVSYSDIFILVLFRPTSNLYTWNM